MAREVEGGPSMKLKALLSPVPAAIILAGLIIAGAVLAGRLLAPYQISYGRGGYAVRVNTVTGKVALCDVRGVVLGVSGVRCR